MLSVFVVLFKLQTSRLLMGSMILLYGGAFILLKFLELATLWKVLLSLCVLSDAAWVLWNTTFSSHTFRYLQTQEKTWHLIRRSGESLHLNIHGDTCLNRYLALIDFYDPIVQCHHPLVVWPDSLAIGSFSRF